MLLLPKWSCPRGRDYRLSLTNIPYVWYILSMLETNLLPIPSLGEFFKEEFLKPSHISATEIARRIGVPGNRMTDIVRNRRIITADTDARLCRYYSIEPGYFLKIQASLEQRRAARELKFELKKIKPHTAYRQFNNP